MSGDIRDNIYTTFFLAAPEKHCEKNLVKTLSGTFHNLRKKKIYRSYFGKIYFDCVKSVRFKKIDFRHFYWKANFFYVFSEVLQIK